MVREIPIAEITAAAYNPRVPMEPGSPEWERLRAGMTEFGTVEPLVWNERTGNLVGGHQRLAVLRSMGHETAPCSIVDLDPADEKLLNVALNKIRGRWDYDRLADVLGGFDSDIALLSGFGPEELAVLLADNDGLEDVADLDLGAWDDEPEAPRADDSMVVTLEFDSVDSARAWAAREGISISPVRDALTTVVRVESLPWTS